MPEAMGLLAVFKSAPGRLDELIDELEEVADAAKHEPGTLAYGLHTIHGESDRVLVYEIYRDDEARRLHGLSDAVTRLKERLLELLAAPPELRQLGPLAGAKGLPF